ncbi:MAG: integrin alpha, partial [Patescibacteria group bacterium]
MKKFLLFLLVVFPLASFSQEEYSLSLFEEFTGEAEDDYAGYSVSSAGDINGDEYNDFLVSADGNDDGGSNAGAAYLIYGQATPYAGTISLADADAEFTGEVAGDDAGISVSSAGDINNDGYDDIIIGAWFNNDGGSYAGAAYLIYGQAIQYSGTISLADADAEFTGEAAEDYAGWSASSAGDVNNDGYDDIIIGAWCNDDGGSYAGAVYLIYGQAIQYSGTISLADANAEFTGEMSRDEAGYSVSSAGDVNNDGYDDFLIGAPYKDDYTGAVYLIYGQAIQYSGTISLADADAKFTGEAAEDWAGMSVSSAGDINNDGYDDILVGAYRNDDAGSNAGAVYLIYGQITPYTDTISLADADAEFTGEAANDSAGVSVSLAGDVNKDGYDDILVGAYYNDDAGSNAGAAYLIYGQAAPYTGTISLADADAEFSGEAANDNAGVSVSLAGDVNSDGYDDVLISAYNNDDAGLDAGAAYLGYLYIDAD